MIISNVSCHTVAQLHRQLDQPGTNAERELRSNGGCGLKLKKEGERGFGFGRAAHRSAAWSRFERVIHNTFAERGTALDQGAYALAKQITKELRGAEASQPPLRLRHVAEVAQFAGGIKDPAGKANAAQERWSRRHEVAAPTRAAAMARGASQGIVGSHRPLSPAAAAILDVCRQTVGDEPVPRASQSAIDAPRAAPQPTGAGRQATAGEHPVTAPRGPMSPQAQRMLEWCHRIPLDGDRTRPIVHRAGSMVRVPVTAVRPATSPPPRQERAPTVVRAASASVPVLAAHRRGEPPREAVPCVNVTPAAPSAADGLTPDHLSLVMSALYADPDWDPADSRGFTAVWNCYAKERAQTAR